MTFRLALILTSSMMFWCMTENARRDRIAAEAGVEELTDEQKRLEGELADNVPWFRYTV